MVDAALRHLREWDIVASSPSRPTRRSGRANHAHRDVPERAPLDGAEPVTYRRLVAHP